MSDILEQIDNGILTLTFNRPAKKNSITSDMYATLAKALRQGATDPKIKVAIIQGQEEVFTAGNDLADFLKNAADSTSAPAWDFMLALIEFPKPLIAAVSGVAIGIGTTLLFHCDLVYASDTAKFMLPFVNLGLCPEAASSFLLPRLISHQQAAKLLMFGDMFCAQEAMSLGIINEIVKSEDVNAHALAQANRLLEKPLVSLMETKRLIKSPLIGEMKKAIDEECEAFASLLKGEALKEAVAAFGEKRKPRFS
ncbi:enoyl-CoA hydratase/isomerase family protein [Bacteriovorax sp. BSW11_IV]|uniref:enoyl-CoA hydratase n=1 Tax=Bacteriovorax sp. BSW11_IV TaxID=1353529 RepID=UPI00038A0299|nr:enoyl-CoA hydratase [Bacteriovorax sp. BSW11_IV]EQC44940.1 enoyl-CoA hydratase/isomerase family protein [Bacteriovorax sp. BSW11_IV]